LGELRVYVSHTGIVLHHYGPDHRELRVHGDIQQCQIQQD